MRFLREEIEFVVFVGVGSWVMLFLAGMLIGFLDALISPGPARICGGPLRRFEYAIPGRPAGCWLGGVP